MVKLKTIRGTKAKYLPKKPRKFGKRTYTYSTYFEKRSDAIIYCRRMRIFNKELCRVVKGRQYVPKIGGGSIKKVYLIYIH